MTQYDERVDYQRTLLKAEEWAGGIKSLHTHRTKSCWYDNRPADTDESHVRDIQYNDGRIHRTIINTGEEVWFKKDRLVGSKLVDEYLRAGR
tara:strand:- start:588 stop:863 length:276 start_codon:yes stop_codon:yes gene_type:complete